METKITPEECLKIMVHRESISRSDLHIDTRNLSDVLLTMVEDRGGAEKSVVICNEAQVEHETQKILEHFIVRQTDATRLVIQDGYGMTLESREFSRKHTNEGAEASCDVLSRMCMDLVDDGIYSCSIGFLDPFKIYVNCV